MNAGRRTWSPAVRRVIAPWLVESAESHDYEPGDTRDPMHTDPLCRICGQPKKDRSHT